MVQVFGLPYPTKAGLVSAGIATGDVQGVATDLLEPIFMMAGDVLREARAEGDHALMIGHATIAGSVSSIGQPMGVHGEIVVTPRHLGQLGDVPKIFGHIHKPQAIYDAVYAGSICRMDFGETEEKRFLVVEFDAAGAWSLHSHPIACPPRYHVEGLLSREGFTWQVTKGPGGDVQPPPRSCPLCLGTGDGRKDPVEGTLPCWQCHGSGGPVSWAGCEVRVRYRFAASEKSVLADAQVLAEFAEAARLEVEPIAVPDRALRAPRVAEARTLAEKLAAFQQVEQLAPSVLEKLSALEHGDALAVLADLQNRLASIEASQREQVAA
jgi:hypothetical protein